MKFSIRAFLLINILLSITLILIAATITDIVTERAALHKYRDNQLKLVANTIEKFANPENVKKDKLLNGKVVQVLQYQILGTKEEGLVLKPIDFKTKLVDSKGGFSDQLINDEEWRVYTQFDSKKNIKLILAERSNFSRNLEFQIILDSLIIFFAAYPILGLMIWIIIGRGFRPLNKIADSLSDREPSSLEPLHFPRVPIEIQPLVKELNRLFERLKSVFEREKRFAGDAAHELRTPLAIIKAQSQVALTAGDEEGRIDALKKVISGVDRSSHVVDQLLVLSRMESQDSYTVFSEVDLVHQVREMVALLVPLALKKDIEIEFQAKTPKIFIQGIPTAIDILVRNLVDNAIRYTQEGGLVQVIVDYMDNKAVLKVIDNGPGVPPELRERVFERFYRVLDNETKGTGLGLGIVRQIIKAHQATITLDTPKTGKGLEIRVYFS